MKVLVANLGSTSFKYRLFDMQDEQQAPGQGAPQADWFSTHPFSPLRLKALKVFYESELAKPSGFAVATLEARVQTLMALMEPSYLEERSETAETARRLLFAAAIAVANATDGISEEEIAVFEKFFGETAFNDRLDIDAIVESLPERIADANTAA